MNDRRCIATWFGLLLATAVGRAVAQPAAWDTLGVRAVLERREALLDSLLLPESTAIDTTGSASLADSLDRGGASAVAARRQAAEAERNRLHLDLGLQPFAMTTYQRVDGLLLGAGLEPTLSRRLRLDLAAAYGFSSHEWSGRAALEVGRRRGPLVRFGWSDRAVPFGPTAESRALGFWALVAGQDRRDYLRRERYEIELWAWRRPTSRFGLRLFDDRESTLDAATDFHFFGSPVPMEEPNPGVDAGRGRGVALQLQHGGVNGRTRLASEVGFVGGVAGGDFEFDWQSVAFALRQYIPGGRLGLEVEGQHVGGSPPLQAAAYLGGDANLRGYDRLEFAGRERASARIEYAVGIDLLQRTRLPGIERLHIQFIPFLDAGSTWDLLPTAAVTSGSLEGDVRTAVGLGFQRALWLPGIEVLRLDVMVRTDGADDAWGIWVRSLSLDEVFGEEDE